MSATSKSPATPSQSPKETDKSPDNRSPDKSPANKSSGKTSGKKGRYRNAPIDRSAGGVVLLNDPLLDDLAFNAQSTEPASTDSAGNKPASTDHTSTDHTSKVLVVHRPRYDDWSLPKGHLDAGETWQQAAIREVQEETGVMAEIAGPPFPVSYLVGEDLPKLVLFFKMHPLRAQAPNESVSHDQLQPNQHQPNQHQPNLHQPVSADPTEVDQVQWWSVAEALQKLSYEVEKEALSALASPDLERALAARRR